MRMARPAAVAAILAFTMTAAACSSSGGGASGKPQLGGTVTIAWNDAAPNFIFPFPPATNTDGYNQNLTAPLWPELSYDGNGGQRR